jgi:ankyrin repeat protein
MRRRVYGLLGVAGSLCLAALPVRAQLDLNPFGALYKNIPRAAQANDAAKIRTLLSDGVSPNQTDENGGTTGMHIAASSGNLQILAILYKAGADINQRDNVGSTPLDYAAEYDRLAAAQLLIEMKAKLNEQNKNGMTALMFAGRTGDVELVRLLLASGANPNLLDYTGRDAAGWALDAHRPSVVRMLKDAEQKH